MDFLTPILVAQIVCASSASVSGSAVATRRAALANVAGSSATVCMAPSPAAQAAGPAQEWYWPLGGGDYVVTVQTPLPASAWAPGPPPAPGRGGPTVDLR